MIPSRFISRMGLQPLAISLLAPTDLTVPVRILILPWISTELRADVVLARKYLLGGRDLIKRPRQGTINGEVILSGRDMEEQLEMGHSCYLVDASPTEDAPAFLFIGLNEALADGKSGKYYFNLFWRDEEATKDDFWTGTATKEKLFETVLEKTKHLPSKFTSIIQKTGVAGMKQPPIRFSTLCMEPGQLPHGRVTLLGDAGHCMPSCKQSKSTHSARKALI